MYMVTKVTGLGQQVEEVRFADGNSYFARDVTTTGWRVEHHSAATKPSDLIKDLPVLPYESCYFEVKTTCHGSCCAIGCTNRHF